MSVAGGLNTAGGRFEGTFFLCDSGRIARTGGHRQCHSMDPSRPTGGASITIHSRSKDDDLRVHVIKLGQKSPIQFTVNLSRALPTVG